MEISRQGSPGRRLVTLSPAGGAKASSIWGGRKKPFFISAPDLVIYCLAFREVFDSKGKREHRRSRA